MEKKYQKLEKISQVIDKYQCFIFDLDGVIFSGSKPIEHAIECCNHLTKIGKKVIFLTNNAMIGRASYEQKLSKNGYPVELSQIYCAASIASQYLKQNHSEVKRAYVVGMDGITEELQMVGIEGIGGRDDEKYFSSDYEVFGELEMDKDIGAVVVGYDCTINYYKLARASIVLQQNKDALFIATNEDKYIKVGSHDYLIPGGGTMVNALKFCTGKQPIITGKPNPLSLEMVAKEQGMKKEEMLMIGDNLLTDIQFGINGGVDSLLVMTGVTDQKELEESSIQPVYVCKDLGL